MQDDDAKSEVQKSEVQKTVEAVVKRDSYLRRFMERCFGSLRGLKEGQLCEAIQFIFVVRAYFLLFEAGEIDKVVKVFVSDLDESQIDDTLAQHLESVRTLERRLAELGRWAEETVTELNPSQPWAGVSPEEILFGPH